MNEQQVGKAAHIATLIIRRMQHKLTDEERSELETWMQEDGENYLLYEELMDEEKLGAALDELHTIDHNLAYQQLSQKLSLAQSAPPHGIAKIWLYIAAALLILIAGSMVYIFTNSTGPPPEMPALQVRAQQKLPAAGTGCEKAFLIPSNNTRIELNAVDNGPIATAGLH